MTPRAQGAPSPYGTPDSRLGTPSFGGDGPTGSYVVLPSTWNDAEEWECETSFLHRNRYKVSRPQPKVSPRSRPSKTYHSETRLASGRPGFLLDTGSVGNLSGDQSIQDIASEALRHGRKPQQTKRNRPLNVSGVGNGAQKCDFDVSCPFASRCTGGTVAKGTYQTPIVGKSMLPALLGLNPMREQRGIIDTYTLRFYMPGPGDYNLEAALPPGTDCIQCELSPSGHMIMPCCDWETLERQESQGGLQVDREITLNVNQQTPPQTSRGGGPSNQ